MKSSLLILSLIVIASSQVAEHPQNEPHTQHTYLIKTDLTKEEVQTLLDQYYQTHQHRYGSNTTVYKHVNSTEIEETQELHQLDHQTNETTQLKVKKQQNLNQHQNLNKQQKVHQHTQANTQPTEQETEPVEEAETVNLKKKTKAKKEKTEPAPAPEVEVEQKTEGGNATTEQEEKTNLKQEENINQECQNTTVLINQNKEMNGENVKQGQGKISGFISIVILCTAFVYFFVYVTQPKKKGKYQRNNFSEITEYFLSKDKNRNEISVRDF
jgi:hypothetical protein